MAENIFDKIPDISFIGDLTLAKERANFRQDFADRFFSITGQKWTFAAASPWTILLDTCAYRSYLSAVRDDQIGKMNLLKYATGDYLDQKVAEFGVKRLEGSKSTTTIRFTLSAEQATTISIPQGTRVSNGGGIYFSTTEYAEIAIGSLYVDVPAECTENGSAYNDILPGTLETLVDLIHYVSAVTNTTETAGGSDRETDDDLRLRAYLAMAALSIDGPEGAYEYLVRSYASSIDDVLVTNPFPVHVKIYLTLDGAELPDQTFLDGLLDYVMASPLRPFTDLVEVSAPVTVSYNISLTYFIAQSDKARAATIQTAVTAAIETYKTWQGSTIGRDINPDELISLIRQAGAKRCEIVSPVFTTVAENQIPTVGTVTVTYGGLEDD